MPAVASEVQVATQEQGHTTNPAQSAPGKRAHTPKSQGQGQAAVSAQAIPSAQEHKHPANTDAAVDAHGTSSATSQEQARSRGAAKPDGPSIVEHVRLHQPLNRIL